MKRLACLLALLLCLTACAAGQPATTAPPSDTPSDGAADAAPVVSEVSESSEPSETDATVDPTDPAEDAETTEPSESADPSDDAADAPEEHNEGDVDSETQAQISALEQSSSVRDDDVAPVEASAYCKLTVSCADLLARQEQLTDVLLPPDGMFYSGTIVLTGGETALQLIADKLAACGLICVLEGDDIQQVAAIPDDLQEDMDWVVLCNGVPLDDPEAYVIQSGDELELCYQVEADD